MRVIKIRERGGNINFVTGQLCTGLKDKDGEPIYEGDILSDHASTLIDCHEEVVWNERRSCLCLKNENGFLRNIPSKINTFKIVGRAE